MFSKKEELKYYFYAISNFLAAFGGGMILGKGINVINISFLQGSSILAFFIGSALGLSLLKFLPQKWSSIIPPLFSSLAAITSLILLCIFKNYSLNGKLTGLFGIIFFTLLCIRFGFWFYSRVLRASLAAGMQQRIAWVELGYYVGMILGLIIWKFLDINIDMISALVLDAALQFCAGMLDLISNTLFLPAKIKPLEKKIPAKIDASISLINMKKMWIWRLARAVMLLTIGIQVVIFSLAHQALEWFSSYIIAFYYLGASIAALVCRKLKMRIEWNFTKSNKIAYAFISSNTKKNKIRISLLMLSIIPFATVIVTILTALHWSHTNSDSTFNGITISLLFFIALSAFFYEVMALSLLDRIALEEKEFNKHDMIIQTYGLMAIAAAFSLWFLSAIKNSFYELLLITLISCLSITILSIRKRSSGEMS